MSFLGSIHGESFLNGLGIYCLAAHYCSLTQKSDFPPVKTAEDYGLPPPSPTPSSLWNIRKTPKPKTFPVKTNNKTAITKKHI